MNKNLVIILLVVSLILTSATGLVLSRGQSEPITGNIVLSPEVDTKVVLEAKLFSLLEDGFDYNPTIPALPDHIYKKVDTDGEFIFLHFDKPLESASKILYTGNGVPGKFCKSDQEQIEEQYGKGFTHFHKAFTEKDAATPEDGHGGEGGEKGYWFRHVAVASFDMPWGSVTPGVDYDFMPTPPPDCNKF